jgi:AhpD family alkylhydroperoxidase
VAASLIQVVGRKALAQLRYVAPVPPDCATGQVAEVYRQVERDFGMLAPPVALHAPAPGVLAASWMMLRETLLAGLADRPGKEAVAAAVSIGNACPYCVQVHTSMLHGLVRSHDAAAIESGQVTSIQDARIRGLAAWASATGASATGPGPGQPFPPAHRADYIGVAVTFQYLNRMVNIFLGDPPLPSALPAAARGAAMRLMGRMFRPLTTKPHPNGASLDLLPEAALPSDLSWASASPAIAGAFARAAAAIEEAAAAAVPPPVRDLVFSEVGERGARLPPPPGRAWLEEAVAGLTEAHRPPARLALLTALASYQVTGSDIEQARQRGLDDAALIGLTAWASLTAARRAGLLLTGPTD